MTTTDDWKRLGEPPADAIELARAAKLDEVLLQMEEEAGLLLTRTQGDASPTDHLLDELRRELDLLVPGLRAFRRPNPHTEPLPDPLPGKFRVLRRLGSGGFGEVVLAEDVALGCPRALKLLHANADDRQALLKALQREGRSLARLGRQRHILPVHAWETGRDGDPILVLEYIAGGSLADRVQRYGPLPWEDAARYLADVAAGLTAVHRLGLVHRDIKPANLLLDVEHDEVLLADFGLVAALGGSADVAGTRLYMAPEAFQGVLSPAMDVYSLAATLFHLGAGEPPFDPRKTPVEAKTFAEVVRQLCERGLPVDDPRLESVPDEIEEVIRAGLMADAQRRPELAAFHDALRGALNRTVVDALASPGGTAVNLRLVVERRAGHGWEKVKPTASITRRTRDVRKKASQPQEQLCLRDGDEVRLLVTADRPGYVAVFNVGPSGNLNPLYPDTPPAADAVPDVGPGRSLLVPELEISPPAGRERFFAVWSDRPLPLQWDDLLRDASTDSPEARSSCATRDIRRLKKATQAKSGECWTTIVEVEHRP